MSRAKGRSDATDTPCTGCGRRRTTSPPELVSQWVGERCPDCDETKLCPDCGEIKSVVDFYPDKSKPSKRSTYCRRCMKERSKLVLAALRTLRQRHPQEFSVILAELKGDT